jgi:lipopolysaccharide transport system ATP-binding protein
MSDTVIRVDGLSKLYRIGRPEDRYKTLRESMAGAVKTPFKRAAKLFRGQPYCAANMETIWALKNVTFEVKRGEVIGIIGRNGAGKTTLLKILSRITEPTEGYAEIDGRVGSLLEVGTGFHPELTGRENIYLNGAILGMKKAEIERKFDEIVAFAEVEKFIDTPVKHYSSGMYVRLAFAVAAHLEPEILMVDEVLAVGDAAFQEKCLGQMGEVARGGRTVLFVSHNMAAIESLCSRAILLKTGCQKASFNSILSILAEHNISLLGIVWIDKATDGFDLLGSP